jgi:predicted transglutaminase-like cysteine proteinase
MSKTEGGNLGNSGIFLRLKAVLGQIRLGDLLINKGLITSHDLSAALSEQKQTQQPLGKIFLKHAKISRKQLFFILTRQWALRGAATSMLYIAALTGIGMKKARAEDSRQPTQISMMQDYNQAASYPALFGSSEKRSANLKPFTKWTSVLGRINNGSGSAAMREWKENIQSFAGLPLKEMAARVNTLANSKPYISDNRNWGTSDYWESPSEFVARGGDCEDFAIAKYAALKSLGVSEDRLRLAIVHDNVKNIPHAVLIVYTDDGIYALDNQNKGLVSAGSEGRYRPIFSINSTGWWLHSDPGATQVASAQ